jgi:hypothetical protein
MSNKLWKGLIATRIFITKWGTWVALLIFFGSYIALQFKLIKDPDYIVGALALLVIGVIGLLSTITEKINTVESCARKADNFIKNYTADFLILSQCYDDLKTRLHRVNSEEKLVIDHIGLGMTEAWDYFERSIHGESLLPSNIEIRMLVLTEISKSIEEQDAPHEVILWRKQGQYMLPTIKSRLENGEDNWKIKRKKVNLEIREYSDIPIIHGFCVREPFKLWYISFCRWKEMTYDWGGDRYHKIDGNPIDLSQRDLIEIFDGHFQHLWRVNKDSAYSYSTQNQPPK